MGSQAQALLRDQQHTTKTTSTQGGILQRAAVIPAITPVHSGLLQRCSGGVECEECRQKRLGTMQRAAVNTAPVNAVPPIVHEVLNSSGQSLDAETRAFMEPRFGYDFSQVRVHTDAKAAESARAVNALAYTVGRDVVFGKGQYVPGTDKGRKLMAHELTHVVQQQVNSSLHPLSIDESSDIHEYEANTTAEKIVNEHTVEAVQVQEQIDVARLQRQTDGDGGNIDQLASGEEVRNRCGRGLGCPLITYCAGKPCAVTDCGTGTCSLCPPQWGLGNLIIRAWCRYSCLPTGSAFILISRIGNYPLGPFCLD